MWSFGRAMTWPRPNHACANTVSSGLSVMPCRSLDRCRATPQVKSNRSCSMNAIRSLLLSIRRLLPMICSLICAKFRFKRYLLPCGYRGGERCARQKECKQQTNRDGDECLFHGSSSCGSTSSAGGCKNLPQADSAHARLSVPPNTVCECHG